MQPANLNSGDTDDLEALFESIAHQSPAGSDQSSSSVSSDLCVGNDQQNQLSEHVASQDVIATGGSSDDPHTEHYDVFHRIGSLTRKLHDALRQLGYDKSVESAVGSLPDARARLNYIANLTGQAAEKVLATVEQSQRIQDELISKAQWLDQRWGSLFNQELSLDEFRAHALETHAFIKTVHQDAQTTHGHLTEIMLAQDFHDLTGQVVNRIATMAQSLEEQLVQLLLDTTPQDKRTQVEDAWLSGPVIDKSSGRTDVCVDQGQVDDLLESLGF